MIMAKNPAALWYFNDWENDPELRTCSLAAQGLWKRMLCIAARSPEPGFVLMLGQNCSAANLPSALESTVGHAATTIAPLIDELLAKGAASRDRRGIVYCRRMVRAAAVSQKRSESGKKGADVTNGKDRGNEGLPRQNGGKDDGKPPGKRAASSRLQDSNASTEPSDEGSERTQAREDEHARRRKPRPQPLSADWRPDGAERRYATDRGLDPDAEAESFRDYYIGRAIEWAVWTRAWQGWCRRAVEMRRQPRGNAPIGGREGGGGVVASANRVLAALERSKPVER